MNTVTDTAPIHPGVHFKSIKLEALNYITHAELAEQLNICRTTLWRFMDGKSRLTPDLAVRLAKLTGESAREWIERQAAFDAHQVESRS
jgi:addiction module HigA family antidote